MAGKTLSSFGNAATEILGSSETVVGTFQSVVERAMSASVTKEQMVVTVAAIGGLVALYAIKNNFSFEYDHEAKRLSFKAPVQAES